MDRDSRGSFLADEECGSSHRKQTLFQKKQKKKKKKKKAEKAFALENLPQLKDQQQLQKFVLNDLMRSVGEYGVEAKGINNDDDDDDDGLWGRGAREGGRDPRAYVKITTNKTKQNKTCVANSELRTV